MLNYTYENWERSSVIVINSNIYAGLAKKPSNINIYAGRTRVHKYKKGLLLAGELVDGLCRISCLSHLIR